MWHSFPFRIACWHWPCMSGRLFQNAMNESLAKSPKKFPIISSYWSLTSTPPYILFLSLTPIFHYQSMSPHLPFSSFHKLPLSNNNIKDLPWHLPMLQETKMRTQTWQCHKMLLYFSFAPSQIPSHHHFWILIREVMGRPVTKKRKWPWPCHDYPLQFFIIISILIASSHQWL